MIWVYNTIIIGVSSLCFTYKHKNRQICIFNSEKMTKGGNLVTFQSPITLLVIGEFLWNFLYIVLKHNDLFLFIIWPVYKYAYLVFAQISLKLPNLVQWQFIPYYFKCWRVPRWRPFGPPIICINPRWPPMFI